MNAVFAWGMEMHHRVEDLEREVKQLRAKIQIEGIRKDRGLRAA